jgi:hypothetical protein
MCRSRSSPAASATPISIRPATSRAASCPPSILDTTEEFFALWREIARASHPSIGLALGTESKPENFDPISLAALSTSSFGDAMRQVARYKQLSCPEEIVHNTSRGQWSIHFRWLLANDPEPEVLTDLCFAWVFSIARHGSGTNISPLRVELAHHRFVAELSSVTSAAPSSTGPRRTR